eukprot:CAMPEP_0201922726 /NCGR_PEP_ID=MMETSP0903-20130614/10681_1 /ASSEMBLY_ACC=CAM_ASM_000552 /TAXON_ID=420261 /ORGANISM="Thalassiosira antarctica, Strain CCMP982" /LENGTH=554 /DNA_ID=CAMNT_0048459913 /DNA_START=59 /DNA_END=1719 /DNA_ORIENTATION=-
MPINIALANGRTVDVETKQGANYFISTTNPESFEFFSSNLEHVQEVCTRVQSRATKRPTEQEILELTAVYATANALAANSDPDTFAKIPQSEIECYVDHAMEQIVNKTNDPHWRTTGILVDDHDQTMIHGLIEFFMHPIPCKLAFQKDFFAVLAKFVAAPPALYADDAEATVMIVTNAVISVVSNKEILSSTEKAFKKLCECGMLAQYIRLSASGSFNGDTGAGVLKFYDELILCSSLIKKNFGKSKPCGDVAIEILSNPSIAGHLHVVQKLKTIMAFTNLLEQQAEAPPSIKEGFKMCRYCNKMEQSLEFQQSLRKCSRCKSTFYCSRECQAVDWKSHKPNCRPVTSSHMKTNVFTENTVLNFVRANYVGIMKEIVKVSSETGKSKSDLLIELDFATPTGTGGLAPALKTPPEYKIAESKGYFEDERPNQPDWFYKNEDIRVYQNDITAVTAALKDTYERSTDDHVLGLVRSPTGDTGCYRLQLQSPTKNHMFSGEAVSAARKAIQEGDFEPLACIIGEDTAAMRKLRRGFGGPPSESELDRVRVAMNAMYGA